MAMKACSITSSVLLHGPLLPTVSLSCWAQVWAGQWNLGVVCPSRPLIWGHFGSNAEQLSAFGLINPEEFVLGSAVDWFPPVAALQGEIQHLEMKYWETTPTLSSTLDWMHMIVFTCKDMVLMFTPSYFSKAETSAVAVSALCGATRVDDLGKPDLFRSFFLFCYLWAPVVPRSRHPRNDHNVGGSRLWDWQLTFQSSWAMDQGLAPISNKYWVFLRCVLDFMLQLVQSIQNYPERNGICGLVVAQLV